MRSLPGDGVGIQEDVIEHHIRGGSSWGTC